MKKSHEIDYKLHGDDLQFVEIELDPGKTVIAEADAAPDAMEASIAFDGENLLSMRMARYNNESAEQVDQHGARESRDDIDAVLQRLSTGGEMSIVIGTRGLPVSLAGSTAAVELFQSCLAKL